MNGADAVRKIVPHAAIAVGACIGAWMMLVEPKLEALAKVEAARVETSIELTPEQWFQLGEQVRRVREWTAEVNELSAISRDSNRLFNIIMELAEAHQVKIVSLQPGQRIGRSGPASRSRDADESVTRTRLDVIASGQYANIAAFLDAIADISMFIRPHSLQLSPADDGPPPIATARLTCDVLAFAIPQSLDQFMGTDDAH